MTHIMRFCFVAGVMLLSGCASKKENISEMGFSQLYNTAMDLLLETKYAKAAHYFEEVDKQHPYSIWASKAQLLTGFSFYRDKKYVEAESAFETFLDLHPGHPDAAYALYMVGMCQYEQLAAVRRDQKATEKALDTFEVLMRRHPNTVYARDGEVRLDLLRDHLAGKELDVARFYILHKAYDAAIPRLQTMIKKYEKTLQVREGLYRLVAAYLGLGLTEEAQRVAAVLGHNYPDSHWYAEAYALMQSHGGPRVVGPSVTQESGVAQESGKGHKSVEKVTVAKGAVSKVWQTAIQQQDPNASTV